MSGAAIFDLDRTLLRGGTGPLLSRAMYDLGVVSRRLPGEGLLFKIFDLVGETLPSIALARQATLVARGRSEGTFDAAAVAAADAIAQVIHPFALTLVEQHRAAGRPVVLATTTPYHLIAPLAERLGFDHVIATRYRVTDGVFDGALAGPFVWSRGKLEAVRDWAAAEGVDLAESFAYSDSIYDLPLLSAVGQPAAVNPDPRLTLYALARGWPIVHFDVSPGVVKLPVVGVELQRLLFLASHPLLTTPYARFDVAGTENIPRTGPAILVGNHRSYFDVPAMIQMMRPTGRTGRILAKRELFDVPVVGALAAALGGIPVDRGNGGKESFETAALALEGRELVCVLPQGTIPRGAKFYEPVLKGRTGAARLAAMSRAPVIPFGVWGTEQVWPRSSPVPRVLNLADPPTVRVRVGPPVELKYRSPAADTRRIMDAIVDCLPPQAREARVPTEEEVRLATPGGVPRLL